MNSRLDVFLSKITVGEVMRLHDADCNFDFWEWIESLADLAAHPDAQKGAAI